jgi:hypothetical protein
VLPYDFRHVSPGRIQGELTDSMLQGNQQRSYGCRGGAAAKYCPRAAGDVRAEEGYNGFFLPLKQDPLSLLLLSACLLKRVALEGLWTKGLWIKERTWTTGTNSVRHVETSVIVR